MRGIGFDIGGSSITAAVVNAGLKGVRLEVVRSVRVSGIEEERARALRSLKLRAAPAAIAVPVHQVSGRPVTLPFAQQTKWDAALPSELEGQIPFELDEVVIDGALMEREGAQSRVLAVALPKTTLRARLEEAARGGVDPKLVTVEAEALAAAAGLWLPVQGDAALVHLDERAVTLVLVARGRVRAMRAVLWDGAAARATVAVACGVPEAALEAVAAGDGPPDVSGRAVADALVSTLKPALDDMARTLRADRVESSRRVAAIAVSGRWSAIPEVGEAVAAALGLDGAPWPSVPVSGGERPLGPIALAAGLGLLAVRGADRLNFRRGEFIYGRERAGLRRRIVALVALAVFALAAAGVDGWLRVAFKQRRWADIDGRVRAAFQEALPNTAIVSEPDQLQAGIDTLAKQRAFLGGRLGVLDVLLALTDAIPPESGIAVSDLSIDQDKVRLEAETASFDWVNKIEGSVAKSPVVKSVTVSDAKTTADQSKVRFIMTVVLAEGV
ncbi:MAG TPA: type II secretion system protein GspL [Nitrospiria bacterium]|nr:type II secretion system protein GspL [Nitrospiria bacterium]